MTTTNERTLFLHWQYHPSDITRQTLCRLYDETLAGKDGFDKNDNMLLSTKEYPRGFDKNSIVGTRGRKS
jgi:hypothetical protein